MAPKKAAAGGKAAKGQDKANAKARAEAKKKQAEDKTFGMKNKNKSKKVQQHISQVNKNVEHCFGRDLAGGKPPGMSKKERKAKEAAEANELFGLMIKQPPVPVGVDPKSVICEFHKHGACTKGWKCKFSHDLNQRKTAKADLFTDQRDVPKEEEETMENWDQETLERAVAQNQSKDNKNLATKIICKFFLEAVEGKLYGWFWKCPNGEKCQYRHALPPGYMLKSQLKELMEEEKANARDMSELVEEERARVDARTPLTQEVFQKWLDARNNDKASKREKEAEARRKKGVLNGREIFMQEGFEAHAGDDVASPADDSWLKREDDQEEAIRKMEQEARERQEKARQDAIAAGEAPADMDEGPTKRPERPPAKAETSGAPQVELTAEDEALFMDDDDDLDDDDLDGLEAELEAKATTA